MTIRRASIQPNIQLSWQTCLLLFEGQSNTPEYPISSLGEYIYFLQQMNIVDYENRNGWCGMVFRPTEHVSQRFLFHSFFPSYKTQNSKITWLSLHLRMWEYREAWYRIWAYQRKHLGVQWPNFQARASLFHLAYRDFHECGID